MHGPTQTRESVPLMWMFYGGVVCCFVSLKSIKKVFINQSFLKLCRITIRSRSHPDSPDTGRQKWLPKSYFCLKIRFWIHNTEWDKKYNDDLSSQIISHIRKIISVADPDPDPPDPHVFGPPGSGSFYHNAKIVRKTLIPTIWWLFLTFYLWNLM